MLTWRWIGRRTVWSGISQFLTAATFAIGAVIVLLRWCAELLGPHRVDASIFQLRLTAALLFTYGLCVPALSSFGFVMMGNEALLLVVVRLPERNSGARASKSEFSDPVAIAIVMRRAHAHLTHPTNAARRLRADSGSKA